MDPLYTAQAAPIETLDAINSVLNIYSTGGNPRHNRPAIVLGQPEINHLQQHAGQIAAEAAADANRLLFNPGGNYHGP